jgi:hypothetical protein
MKDAETHQNVALSARSKPSKFALERTAKSFLAPPVESLVTGPAIPSVVHHNLPQYFGAYEALIDTLDRYPDDLVSINHCEINTNTATRESHTDAIELL